MPKSEEAKNKQEPAATEKKKKAEPMSFRLDEDMRKAVEDMCAQEKIPVGVLVRQALQNYIGSPARQRGQVLRSLAITRDEIEKARAAGVIPEDTAARLQGNLEDGQETVKAQKLPRKSKPFRFPQAPIIGQLLWGNDEQ